MSTLDPSARGTLAGAIAVWVAAALMGVAVGLFAPIGLRAGWLSLALGGCLILTFALQLWIGRAEGFIARIALSMLGAFVILAVAGAVFGLIAIGAV